MRILIYINWPGLFSKIRKTEFYT